MAGLADLTPGALFFFAGFMAGLSNPWEIAYGVSPALKVMLGIPLTLCVFLPVLIYIAFKLTIHKGIQPFREDTFLRIDLSLLLFLWQLNHWSLLGFKY